MLLVVKQLVDSMVSNAVSVREQNANECGECEVSIDGSWQKVYPHSYSTVRNQLFHHVYV